MVWITTQPHAAGLDGTWMNYTSGDYISDFDGDGSVMWCATSGGVVRWEVRAGTYTCFTKVDGLLSNNVRSVYIDGKGRVWAGCTSSGVCCYENGAWKRFIPADGAPDGFNVAYEARNGVMWFGGGSSKPGVYRYDGASWTSWPASNPPSRAVSIAADGTGAVWFVVGNSAWKNEGRLWTRVYSGDYMMDSGVNSVSAARGFVWFATENGISKFDGSRWKAYRDSDGIPGGSFKQIVAGGDGVVWARKAEGGIIRYKEGTWSIYGQKNGLPSNLIVHVAVDEANVAWFCSNPVLHTGVTSFDGVSWTTYTAENSGLAGNGVGMSLGDGNGGHWFSTDNGLSRRKGEDWTTFPFGEGGAPDSTVSAGVASDGQVWFGTGNGLYRFNGSEWVRFSTADGLPDSAITALAFDEDGRLWIATPKGICRYDDKGLVRLPEKDWLISGSIEDIIEDENGVMWFGTWNGGLSRFDGTRWRTYNTSDGLDCDGVRLLDIDRSGNLLAGTYSKLYRLTQDGFKPCTEEMIEPAFQYSWFHTNKGLIAAGDNWKITIYDLASGETFTIPYPSANTDIFGEKLLFEDRDTYWSASTEGLVKMDAGVKTVFRTGGLPESAQLIRDAAVDSRNVKWFLSSSCLSRFDGRKWTWYQLDSLLVSASNMVIDNEDRVWISGMARVSTSESYKFALVSFNGEKWERYICDIPECAEREHYEPEIDRYGAVWFHQSWYLLRFHQGEWTKHSHAKPATATCVTANLFGCNSMTGKPAAGTPAGPPDISGEGYSGFYIDSRGGVWSGDMRWFGNEWKRGLFWTAGYPVDVDSRGRVWASRGTIGGIITYLPWELTYDVITDVLPHTTVQTVMVDHDDNVWVGTWNGIARYIPKKGPALISDSQPVEFGLTGLHPNPFNPRTSIGFVLPSPLIVRLAIYDITGRLVRTLRSGRMEAGRYTALWDGRDDAGREAGSGIYFARLAAGRRVSVAKMTLLR